MTKCVKITCNLKFTKVMIDGVQKWAQKLGLEGSLQIVGADSIRIIACGLKENIDTFVDMIYKEGEEKKDFLIEVEPFLKDRDYRGIFRIIV